MPIDQASSRRQFLKFLAASPLLAASDLAVFANETPSRLPDPMVWSPRNLDKLEDLFCRHMQASPYVGRALTGRVVRTMLRGRMIFRDGEIISPPMGRPVKPG